MSGQQETELDRQRERDAIDILAGMYGLKAMKMPQRCWVDFAIIEPSKKIRCYAEVKWRDVEYKTMWISLMKAIRGVELSESSKIPFRMVYWIDCKYLIHGEVTRESIMGSKIPIVFDGRKLKRNNQEDEPILNLDVSKWDRIETP